jgi:hypothetical protein
MRPRLLIVAAALTLIAPVAQAGCAPPPPWRQVAPRGRPAGEMRACLRDKAYDARNVAVPVQSKAAGITAQCEVEVDHVEGGMPFGGSNGQAEQAVAQEANAAVLEYQSCADPKPR